ncbi:MAG: rhodanese-like domain-containing protein [Actinomycetia bacterium]|nr:rhodanese-like domain-containing protein [Actinomycetes bacterium]
MRLLRQNPAGGHRRARAVLAALAVTAILVTAGCGDSLPPAGNVDNAAAKSLASKGVRIIDVRTASEYEAGHIPQAENVPLDQLGAAIGSWDSGKPVLVYCAVGDRSVEAMRMLTSAGFKTVYNLQGGIVAWDGDVTSGSGGSKTAGTLSPSASGLPVLYEFYTDW